MRQKSRATLPCTTNSRPKLVSLLSSHPRSILTSSDIDFIFCQKIVSGPARGRRLHLWRGTLADETSLRTSFALTDFVPPTQGTIPVALDTLLDVLEGTPDASFSTFYPLVDPNQAEYLEFIVVQGTQNLDQPLPNAQIVAQLKTVSTLVARAFNVDVELTGEVALANEEIGAALTGIEIAGACPLSSLP